MTKLTNDFITKLVQEAEQHKLQLIDYGVGLTKAYENIGTTSAELHLVENEIKLKEASEFLNLESDGKVQLAVVNKKAVALTNDKLRDAFRRLSSEELRIKRADLLAQQVKVREEIAYFNSMIKISETCLSNINSVLQLYSKIGE